MRRFRRVMFGWVWRGGACVVAFGYFFGVCALGRLHPAPGYERLPAPALVITALVSFAVAATIHRLLVTRWRAWKPKRSVVAMAVTVASAVVLVPLAIACWPVTIFVFMWRRAKPLTPEQRLWGLAFVSQLHASQR